MLLVAGFDALCRYTPVHCPGPKQQLTFRWEQSIGGFKVSEPLPTEVTGSVAAVTHSKVSKPATVTEVMNLNCQHLSMPLNPAHRNLPLLLICLISCGVLCCCLWQRSCISEGVTTESIHQQAWSVVVTSYVRLVIPNADALRQCVMYEMHDSPFCGHVGVKKTRKAVERPYTGPSMKEDVEECVSCTCTFARYELEGEANLQPVA